MNIQQAKDQIKHAVKAYFTRNDLGEFRIPVERQRPIFLMGPPGIGKTAIMEQIAGELGVGLVAYSMTHHTRQSALGLPFIVQKSYGGREYSVSEYTMSEIIAAVHDRIEEDGAKEGILFLDEINCVSETLAPSMLQFLQYKTFGRHRVPDGWIVVTAGNPPEYNDSVREFDIVTWDRLKRVDVEPDFGVWKSYAHSRGVHPAVVTYLEIKTSDFYLIETTVDGKSFVTARGWVDLSEMIKLYELHGFKVDEALVIQYLQNRQIAKQFAIYYDLFNKYKSDYQVDEILAGRASESILERARKARLDERISLLGLLLDAVNSQIRDLAGDEQVLRELMAAIKAHGTSFAAANADRANELLVKSAQRLREGATSGQRSGMLSARDGRAKKRAAEVLLDMGAALQLERPSGSQAAFALIKKLFDQQKSAMKDKEREIKQRLNHLFIFCEQVFPDGQELVILVTELTANQDSALFISRYGCEKYFQHNKELLFYERQTEIIKELEELEELGID
jgi:DNA polymerase III delta prime subunit